MRLSTRRDIKRAESIYLLESSLHRYSLLSASEYLLEFEKKLSYMLHILYIVCELRIFIHDFLSVFTPNLRVKD